MAIDLNSKPIAITGASSGIGAATAIACAAAGMPVVIGARRIDKLAAVVDRIQQSGGRAQAVPCDVTRPEDCERLVAETIARFGSVYAVYANAGYGEERAVSDMSDAELRAMFETNFFGTMNVIRPALARMLESNPTTGEPRGHILICSSCLAKLPIPYVGAYCATKAAQSHVGRAMAMELQPRGVNVSIIHPIGTKTEFFDILHARGNGQIKVVDHTPGAFMQSPEYVAKLTVKCLRRPRPEVWTGPMGKTVRVGMSLANIAPRITDIALRSMVKRRMFPHQ